MLLPHEGTTATIGLAGLVALVGLELACQAGRLIKQRPWSCAVFEHLEPAFGLGAQKHGLVLAKSLDFRPGPEIAAVLVSALQKVAGVVSGARIIDPLNERKTDPLSGGAGKKKMPDTYLDASGSKIRFAKES